MGIGITRIAKGCAAVGLAAAVFAAPGQATELKLAHFMSPKHPMDSKVMRPMAEELAKASNGKLTIRIFPAGELGKGPVQQYKRAVDGVADMVFGIPGYTSTQFPKTLLIALPGVTKGPEDATRMLWGAYDEHLADEFARVKMLGLWANGLAVLITKDKPIRSVADVKGLKIRAPDAVGAKAIAAWGGTPVNMPVSKIYNALNTGVVDGVMIGASGIRSFKLHEIGNHFTTGLPSTVAAFYLIANKNSWDRLTKEEQAAVEALTGFEFSLKAARVYGRAADGGLQAARDAGREIIELTPQAYAEFENANQKVIGEVMADLANEGIDGRVVLSAMNRASQ